jgi:hypothetical protein
MPTAAATPGVCENDAGPVSDRVRDWYQAAGYPSSTYEGLAGAASRAYVALCGESTANHVARDEFCAEVVEVAWQYFEDQYAGTLTWINDCEAGRFL